jgi:sodium/bile acid cotransporter 7
LVESVVESVTVTTMVPPVPPAVAAHRCGSSRADETAIVFCGSKKSLASGLPMAPGVCPAATVELTVLPLMMFPQPRLIVCPWPARRQADHARARR